MRRSAILFAAIGLLMGAEHARSDSGLDELKRLQGPWSVMSFEDNGAKVPDDVAKKWTLRVKDDAWILQRGDHTTKGTIKLHASKKPKAFDAVIEGSGSSVFGLYEIQGDTLKMCWTASGGDRPTELKGEYGKSLVVYKKAKPE
jgi:uncharacterized protein (TIGR03067 family)